MQLYWPLHPDQPLDPPIALRRDLVARMQAEGASRTTAYRRIEAAVEHGRLLAPTRSVLVAAESWSNADRAGRSEIVLAVASTLVEDGVVAGSWALWLGGAARTPIGSTLVVLQPRRGSASTSSGRQRRTVLGTGVVVRRTSNLAAASVATRVLFGIEVPYLRPTPAVLSVMAHIEDHGGWRGACAAVHGTATVVDPVELAMTARALGRDVLAKRVLVAWEQERGISFPIIDPRCRRARAMLASCASPLVPGRPRRGWWDPVLGVIHNEWWQRRTCGVREARGAGPHISERAKCAWSSGTNHDFLRESRGAVIARSCGGHAEAGSSTSRVWRGCDAGGKVTHDFNEYRSSIGRARG